MWVKSIRLKNIKSFADSGPINFTKGINVIVGPNNSGKSAILRAVYFLQGIEGDGYTWQRIFLHEGLRVNEQKSEVILELSDADKAQLACLHPDPNFNINTWTPEFIFSGGNTAANPTMRKNNPSTGYQPVNPPIVCQREPNNFIYPYFWGRNPPSYDLAINVANATAVQQSFGNLPAKIDRISNPHAPGYELFEETCEKCFGFPVSTTTFKQGKQAGFILKSGTFIPLEMLGAGTFSILTFLSHLCAAKGKLFLIEEPENDIHPTALKALLDIIIKQSAQNQFIVSTHNNIVLRTLGSVENAKVFALSLDLGSNDGIPTSTCSLVEQNAEARCEVLKNLGYNPSDFLNYDAYLIVEESTAEKVIRDFMIPYMFPKLQGRLRTIAARGISDVEASFHDLHRLFVFIHKQPVYASRAWVAVDQGPEAEKIIGKLRETFKTWDPTHFQTFPASNFEEFYPAVFQDKVSVAFAEKGLSRQKLKGELAVEVTRWAIDNTAEAKAAFDASAPAVLKFLADIQAKLEA
jgi:hypothetical protein